MELQKCVRSLQVDIECFIRNKYCDGSHFKDEEYRKKVEEGVWDIKSENNELTQRINKAIENIEAEIRPHLSRT
jgi:formiminotetrahydrofolate cyclodeaminase